MSTVRVLRSLLLVSALVGCQYDLDEIYSYSDTDAGGGASDDDASMAPVRISEHLVGLWTGYPGVDQDCAECAESSCAEAEAECRGDAACVAYTECVAAHPTPPGQADCRVQHAAWVRGAMVRARDLNGPYGQCVFREKCAAQCSANDDLSCLGTYAWPGTNATSVPLTLFLNDALVQTMFVPGVTVKACWPEELGGCANPLATGVSDARGMVMLDLPTRFMSGFPGYLQLEKPDILPTLLKFAWNITTPLTQVVTVINEETLKLSLKGEGELMLDPEKGMLQQRMLGCNGMGVRGVSFSLNRSDDAVRTWYMSGGQPSFNATETDALGAGGMIDVPPGATTVTATRVSDGAVVGQAHAPILPGFMTIVVMAPKPSQ